MDNVKLKNNSLYGKFKDQPIYLDTDHIKIQDPILEWIEIHDEQYRKAEKIANILGISHVKVLTTTHEKLMEMLVDKIEIANAKLKIAETVIESIETFIKVNGR